MHIFDVHATEFGPWGTDDTVSHNFSRDYVGCTCGEIKRIINEVAANSDSDSIWLVLLGAVVDGNSCVLDGMIFWDAHDFSMG
jgi:hypothetical protein